MDDQSLDLLALRLKLRGSRIKNRAFLSFGSPEDKLRLLPSAQKLAALGVQIYATTGTSVFLEAHGIANTRVSKINEQHEPDVGTYLREGLFDLVVNILTDHDYLESTDARIIRNLALEHHVPIVTDVTHAIETIDRLALNAAHDKKPRRHYGTMKEYFLAQVLGRGGFADNHGHLDKSMLMTPEMAGLGNMPMQQKWTLYRKLKEDYTFDDLVERMSLGLDFSIAQGVTHLRTMVDADSFVKLLCLDAALEVKRRYQGKIVLEVGIQPLEGVLNEEPWRYVEAAFARADFLGGLPSKDNPREESHLDRILKVGKEMGKRVDVHVDQKGVRWENETKLLALKTIEHGMQGRVSAVHSIISRKSRYEQREIAKVVKDAGIIVQICAGAAIGMEQFDDESGQISNCVAPVQIYREEGVGMAAGTDNRLDPFCPFSDGDMWVEARMLMEASRIYEAPFIADIFCNKSLFADQTQALSIAA